MESREEHQESDNLCRMWLTCRIFADIVRDRFGLVNVKVLVEPHFPFESDDSRSGVYIAQSPNIVNDLGSFLLLEILKRKQKKRMIIVLFCIIKLNTNQTLCSYHE